MSHRVTFYTREGCHLCEAARATVQEVCAETGVEWVEVDIDTDPKLREKYGDEVPVVLADDAVVGFWRIDAGILRRALA
ncbi:glutaredoxin family protein [Demequina aurantiaca]|uniref:glutaredoxin family protein n=1 Tax=Demequina aurantiaca TaxID=676200 RepID=UPI0007831C47|nr:glutaredoxin family protein [Demequina aurantiaca]